MISPVSLRICLLVFLFGLGTCLILLALPRFIIGHESGIRFDMDVSAGRIASLYLNRFDRPPVRMSIAPGRRQNYASEGVFSDITMIRLDLSDTEGAVAIIYGVEVFDREGILRQIAPAELATWGTHDLKLLEVSPDLVRFAAIGPAPYLMTGTVVRLRHSMPAWFATLARSPAGKDFLVPLLAIGFLLLAATKMIDGRQRADLPLTVATVLIAVLVVPWLAIKADGLSAIDHAVGRAGYFGTSSRGNSVGLLGCLGFTLLVTSAAVGWSRRPIQRFQTMWLLTPTPRHGVPATQASPGGPARAEPLPAMGSPRRKRCEVPRGETVLSRASVALMVIGLLAIILAVTPDWSATIDHLTNGAYVPDWDGNNILLWSWLAHQGYMPLRDFWYPYGGFYLFDLPAPWSLLMLTLYRWWIYGMLFVLLYRLSGKFLMAVAVVLLLVTGELTFFFGIWRHVLAVLLILSYLALGPQGQGRTVFWLSAFLVTLFEPVQLAYAGPAIALKFGLDYFQSKQPTCHALLRALQDFGPPALVALLYVAVLVALGAGPGFFDFLRSLSDARVYSAEPTNLVDAMASPLQVSFIVVAAPFLLLALGMWKRLSMGGANRLADTMLMLGMLGFMMLQKHLVRPIAWQLFFIPYLGAVCYLLFQRQRRRIAELAAIGLLSGATAAALIQLGAVASLWHMLETGPSRLAHAAAMLIKPGNVFALANQRRFAPARFDSFSDERAVVADLASTNRGKIPPIFVLGSSPAVYILAGQIPPYHANDYNASPIYEQQKVADFLNRVKPPVVIWDPGTKIFDLFQTMVRDPLIYNSVIASYVPDHRTGRFEVLRRRTSGEPVALDFWRERLEPTASYGHFARASSFSKFQPCGDDVSQCQEFLTVTKRDPTFAGRLTIVVQVEGRRFEIAMETISGEQDLHVLLDRVWFWAVVKNAGPWPQFDLASSSPGLDVKVEPRAARPDILY
jgi:hypothetical protein